MKVAWQRRDILIFAASIGCKADESHFLYELHPNFQIFPTYPVILSFKDDTQEVIHFHAAEEAQRTELTSSYPNLPQFDSTRVVDGQRSLKIMRPLPVTSAGRSFEMKKEVLGVYDKGNAGSVLHAQHTLIDVDSEEVYAVIEVWSFYVGQGNWGGQRGSSMGEILHPERRPDIVAECQTAAETPLLYRLNGDYNPLHADPAPGQAMGFGGVILHGLIAWNISAHAILREICGGEGNNLKEVQARFAAPVLPGDKLVVEIWRMGIGEDGWQEVRFVTRVDGGKCSLNLNAVNTSSWLLAVSSLTEIIPRPVAALTKAPYVPEIQASANISVNLI
ncbi:related to multifunctional beta-oxidation protein [Phialocephala subalpina]|uniref:Related to multifunctional beta-oxidation protein n=1 Tax=Phialocephala subalpina TaxID=576137 RepID=A0A1L7WRH0_9HELO|nr:related to multifunctional beta-oxidation protein [Phialocephala subalpina]